MLNAHQDEIINERLRSMEETIKCKLIPVEEINGSTDEHPLTWSLIPEWKHQDPLTESIMGLKLMEVEKMKNICQYCKNNKNCSIKNEGIKTCSDFNRQQDCCICGAIKRSSELIIKRTEEDYLYVCKEDDCAKEFKKQYTYCYECELYFPKSELKVWNGKLLCERCTKFRVKECKNCGGIFDKSETVNYGNYYYCHSCFDNNQGTCAECGMEEVTFELTMLECGELICRDCEKKRSQLKIEIENAWERVEYYEHAEPFPVEVIEKMLKDVKKKKFVFPCTFDDQGEFCPLTYDGKRKGSCTSCDRPEIYKLLREKDKEFYPKMTKILEDALEEMI